jgi:mannose-6-phosphate isomerase
MERASIKVVGKPWGKTDLTPWSDLGHDGSTVGELWFERADPSASEPALLLKLLFVAAPLSIQVHPGDAFATSIGLPHGKTEAWYVVSAEPEAQVALGLERGLTPAQLRVAIEDGSIAELVQWRSVGAGDALLVPAGSIHAIGAGLVIAEIQQRSDATFRMFDQGRKRELHLDSAVAASHAGPATPQVRSQRLSEAREVLAQSPYFVLEHIELAPNAHFELNATVETWVMLLEGEAAFDLMQLTVGEAMFIEAHGASVWTSGSGAKGVMAYAASAPLPDLLVSRSSAPMAGLSEPFPEPGLALQPAEDLPTRPWGMHV